MSGQVIIGLFDPNFGGYCKNNGIDIWEWKRWMA